MSDASKVDVEILDGAAVVHMLPLKGVKIFDGYAVTLFMAYILRKLQKVERIDIVWDRYLPMSLKKATREIRGVGRRRQVLASTPLSKSMKTK